MHPIFEAVYVPAFIKAANANGRVFKDVEDLGEALKLAMAGVPPPAPAPAAIPAAPKPAALPKAPVGVLKGGTTLPLPSSPDSKMASLQQKLARLKVAARVINADVGLDQIINHMKKARAKKAVEKTANVKDFGMTLAKKALRGSALAKDKALRRVSRDLSGPLNDVERMVANPSNKAKQRPRLRELLAYAKQYRDKKPLELDWRGRPDPVEPVGLLEQLKAQLANPKNTQRQRSTLRQQLAKAQAPASP